MVIWLLLWFIPAIILLCVASSLDDAALSFVLTMVAFIPIGNITALLVIIIHTILYK